MSGEQKTADIRILPGFGRRPVRATYESVNDIIDAFEEIIIIGRPKDRSEHTFYVTSHDKNADILWDLEQVKMEILL